MKARSPLAFGNHRRFLKPHFLAIAALLILFGYFSYNNGNQAEESTSSDGHDGWAGSFLHSHADPELNERVDAGSKMHRFNSCNGDTLKLKDAPEPMSGDELAAMLDKGESTNDAGEQRFVEVTALSVPCG